MDERDLHLMKLSFFFSFLQLPDLDYIAYRQEANKKKQQQTLANPLQIPVANGIQVSDFECCLS